MPGVVTHSRVIHESIELLKGRKKKSFLLRSLLALFNSKEFLRAAMFGALGPNIFDFYRYRKSSSPFGSDISFFLHDGGSHALLQAMIEEVLSYRDKNNEWAAFQRAYLYGFISHIMGDAFYHPFIFYFSGFPDSGAKEEQRLYREQNLLFQYNIDNYYLYYAEPRTDFSLDDMLPVSGGRSSLLNQSIKSLIINSVKKSYPEFINHLKIPVINRKSADITPEKYNALDVIPHVIKAVYTLKFTGNRKLKDILRDLRKYPFLFSDYLVCYPEKRFINRHVLNLHAERWQYPVERPGVFYDSVDSLMKNCCEKTVSLWEKIEAGLYGAADLSVLGDLDINAYTGGVKAGYFEMKNKSPVRIRY
ncbi:MAG TPA: zinc dependent phospholipase C family protein [Spirochaetota bacterium]|nr:zinc dependent phospholipase C family protein [Spirochaetota bacterium]HPI89774.1 zinc dependent phospholipase C family protein [Spirochaetota bacterium]HPR47603.1 zinc dependent phospholipase C family protein [Spirochaetota bacterium]